MAASSSSLASPSVSASSVTLSSLRTRVPNLVIIGVCGASASGKTSIAHHLHTHYKSAFPVVGIDTFFDYGEEPWYYTSDAGRRLFDIEYPRSVAFSNMMIAIRSIVHSYDPIKMVDKQPILILEGFLLFSYQPLLTLIEPCYRFFICADGWTCCKRRFNRQRGHMQRVPDDATIMDGRDRVTGKPTPDTNWLRHNDFFMSLVWPAFLHCNAHIIRWAPPHWLDSSLTPPTPTSTIPNNDNNAVDVPLPLDGFLHPQCRKGTYCSDAKGPADEVATRLPESRWTPGTAPSASLINTFTIAGNNSNNNGARVPITFVDGNLPLMMTVPDVIQRVNLAMKPPPTLTQLRSYIPDLIIVGIGGASGTGKTSVAAYIHYHFKSSFPLVCMDAYFDDGGQAWRYASDAENQHYDIEYTRNVRYDQMMDHMLQLVKDYRPTKDRLPIMVVEGFLLYSNASLVSLIEPHLRFFLVAPPMLCSTRRFTRDHRRILPTGVAPMDGRGATGKVATDEAMGTQKLWLRHNDFYWTTVWPAFLQLNCHLLRYVPPSLLGSPPELLAAFPASVTLPASPLPLEASSPAATTAKAISSSAMETKTLASLPPSSPSSSTSSSSVATGTGMTGLYHPLIRNGGHWCDAISPSAAIPPRTALGAWLPGAPPSAAVIQVMTRDEKTGRLPFVILDGALPVIANVPVIIASLMTVLRQHVSNGTSKTITNLLRSGTSFDWDASQKMGRLFTVAERIVLLRADHRDASIDVDDATLIGIITMLSQ